MYIYIGEATRRGGKAAARNGNASSPGNSKETNFNVKTDLCTAIYIYIYIYSICTDFTW